MLTTYWHIYVPLFKWLNKKKLHVILIINYIKIKFQLTNLDHIVCFIKLLICKEYIKNIVDFNIKLSNREFTQQFNLRNFIYFLTKFIILFVT